MAMRYSHLITASGKGPRLWGGGVAQEERAGWLWSESVTGPGAGLGQEVGVTGAHSSGWGLQLPLHRLRQALLWVMTSGSLWARKRLRLLNWLVHWVWPQASEGRGSRDSHPWACSLRAFRPPCFLAPIRPSLWLWVDVGFHKWEGPGCGALARGS